MTDKSPDNSQSDPEILEQIVEHFTNRLRAGEHPAIADYQSRYPKFKDEIEDLLASVAMIEQLKSDPTNSPAKSRSLDEVSGLEQIGQYKINGEIGRGGMGVVFEAVHESLGKRVAIKVMPTPLINSKNFVERFKREAQSAARLHHTNIVSVFGVGEGEGYHYYVMDLIEGQTLGAVINGFNASHPLSTKIDRYETRVDISGEQTIAINASPPSEKISVTSHEKTKTPETPTGSSQARPSMKANHYRWAARIAADIANAVAFAHDADLLHRDIKPSNIILDQKGQVWITDFGLAKDTRSDINLTKTGDVIGTPQYLSPESLEGKYDCRSEVYCIGLTLYELATLQPAFNNGTTAEVIRAIATSSPPSPRKISPSIPIDLSTIIEKSISRNAEERYPTVKDLQRDLIAFVEDRTIAARPPSTIEMISKWGRRNPLAASLSVVSCVLLLLVAVATSFGYLYTKDALKKEAQKSALLEEQIIKTEKANNKFQAAYKKQESEYQRAERNVDISIQAFDRMFKQLVAKDSANSTELSIDGLEDLQGIETSITKQDAVFLEEFLAFYDKFATNNFDNKDLQAESARAFRRVANIYQLLGEFDRSFDAYKKSIDLYNKVLVESPDSKESLIALVQTKNELSRAYRRDQNLQQAIAQNQSAIQLLNDVPIEQLDNELKLELAKTFNSIGSSLAINAVIIDSLEESRSTKKGNPGFHRRPEGHRPPNWMELYLDQNRFRRPPPRKGQDLTKRPNTNRPNTNRFNDGPGFLTRGPGRARTHEANLRLLRRSNENADRAITILDQLIDDEPDNPDYRSARAECYCCLACSFVEPDQKAALNMRSLAIKELESLIAESPNHSIYLYRLALAYSLSNPSDSPENRKLMLERSIKIANDLKIQFPKVLDYHYLFISVQNTLAVNFVSAGNLDEALKAFQNSKETFKAILQLNPNGSALRQTDRLFGVQLRSLVEAAENNNTDEKIARSAKDIRKDLDEMISEYRIRQDSTTQQ
ncbi:serine/threonine-protein kinase [bacterium]|nr:serine/threonine-protein kinase [bacterium]MDA7923828.1 serine/threonine-protein kinase [Mariniblastus sp.]MDA7911818.1 serine/threonine-protein kinase [bacterium]MDA7929083.1 serine/threonine-protein kinase [Mariniblastus sp.]MDB4564577.1 serine/threonine-protein kinase [Mariniblastus sp.]